MGRVRNIHLIGIGGCGMSALAKILHEKGYHLTGSDLRESVNTIRLKDLNIPIFFRHRASNVRGADVVVYSAAVVKENVELQEATMQNIPIMGRAEMLGWILQQSSIPICVCGTHGKTTTTSMLSLLFEQGGLDPTFLIGENNELGGNARLGNGRYAIAEADESDGSFNQLAPKILVLTNLEADHLDYYGNLDAIVKAFVQYVDQLPEDVLLVTNSDHLIIQDFLKKLKGNRRILTYGNGSEAMVRAENPRFEGRQTQFEVLKGDEKLGSVILNIPGVQNILNALAAITVGLHVGLDFKQMTEHLQHFMGARRRFQAIGHVQDILIFDDYAHHPTEVQYTLQAARLGWPDRRIIAVFQPHRFTRTALMAEEFGGAFDQADIAIISNVYSAGEEKMPGVTGRLICKASQGRGENILYMPKKEKISDFLMETLKTGDLLITMGAGDIYTVAKEVSYRLKERVKQAAPELLPLETS